MNTVLQTSNSKTVVINKKTTQTRWRTPDETDPRMRQHDAWEFPDVLHEAFEAGAPIEAFRDILQAHNPGTMQTINVRRLFQVLRWAISLFRRDAAEDTRGLGGSPTRLA